MVGVVHAAMMPQGADLPTSRGSVVGCSTRGGRLSAGRRRRNVAGGPCDLGSLVRTRADRFPHPRGVQLGRFASIGSGRSGRLGRSDAWLFGSRRTGDRGNPRVRRRRLDVLHARFDHLVRTH